MEKNKLICLFVFISVLSCKKEMTNSTNTRKIKTEVIKKESIQTIKQDSLITTSELKSFFIKIKDICDEEKKVELFLSKKVLELYPNFCELINSVYYQKDGEIDFEIYKHEGIITINSIEYITEHEEKYRNEYSTFFYIIKEKEKLVINKIGGAG